MEASVAEDMVREALDRLPQGLSRRLGRIPAPERAAVLEEAGVPLSRMVKEMEEEDIRALDKALRYKDSRVQLVRMTLITRIRNDVEEPEAAEEMAVHILENHPLDSVHAVYDTVYRGNFPLAGPLHEPLW